MDQSIVHLLKQGQVGVLATDTIYGLVGSALIEGAVEKIYQLRQRNPHKPMITLISSINDLNHFNINPEPEIKKFLEEIWPNPVSVILPCPEEKFSYLHRGTKSLAFRLPKKKSLIELIKETGPLVAPSANLEGMKEAETIEEAKKYFGERAAFYVDEGRLSSPPSTLIKIEDKKIILLREGAYKLPELTL